MTDDLAALGKLWPHRQHESNWLKALFCAAGFHRWHTLTFNVSPVPLSFDFCRWCPKVRPQETRRSIARTTGDS